MSTQAFPKHLIFQDTPETSIESMFHGVSGHTLVCLECDMSMGGQGLWEGDKALCLHCGSSFQRETYMLGSWSSDSEDLEQEAQFHYYCPEGTIGNYR